MRNLNRVVVSGATSFLGSAVVRALLQRGCQVYGIVRPASKSKASLPDHPSFHTVLCDISETDKWVRAIGNADTFFHFSWGGPGIAGRSDPIAQHQSAVDALNSIPAAGVLGVKLFFLSGSQAEYGQVNGMISEDTPCNPVLEYGKNKLAVCQAAPRLTKELDMKYIHARFFSVYGPNDHPYTLIPSCIRCFLAGGTMELSECTNMWNFLHVNDAAEAAVQLAECELDRQSVLVNLAGTDTRVLRDFVSEIHELAGNKGLCAFGTRRVSEKPVDNWPDTTRLQQLISWKPKVSFEEGIRELLRMEEQRIFGGSTV